MHDELTDSELIAPEASHRDAHQAPPGAGQREGRGIVCVPGVQGGIPIIADTRVPVKTVVQIARGAGYRMREILAALPTLNATEIRNALAYYDSHQEEIEADIAADAQSDLLPL